MCFIFTSSFLNFFLASKMCNCFFGYKTPFAFTLFQSTKVAKKIYYFKFTLGVSKDDFLPSYLFVSFRDFIFRSSISSKENYLFSMIVNIILF
jgi:hypothetical protein